MDSGFEPFEYEPYVGVESVEHETYRNWWFGQEVVREERIVKLRPESKGVPESEWLESRIVMIRQEWHITNFTTSVREHPTWFYHPVARILVLYTEWPQTN